ncbi:MAG: cbb3-type cytochrome oxidase assembly protein CcoS [Azoarcus sp.]|jgi:cbb3-type cytochrome oxidase maturation protein|nr:cbb3-type cytochrome oxidase assembly protein CcoS [Azoarcus sp.]
MEASLYILIPISVLLVFVIGALFWWSLRTGQYDDLEGPAHRLLFDDRDEPEDGQEHDVGTDEHLSRKL